MIQKYKNIAIIYGGSGRDYAEAIRKAIERKHHENMLPIQPKILDKTILDSKSIMDYVTGMLSMASVFVIILTFDDVDGTRVRQNVLIETGIAWALGGKKNCIFLSDKSELPADFPSNIRSDININTFESSEIDTVAEEVCNEIIDKLRVNSAADILHDELYEYNGRILDDIPDIILEKKPSIQMHEILAEWANTIQSFDYYEEKLMYLLERLPFIPVFTNDRYLHDFLEKVGNLLAPSRNDMERYRGKSNSINMLCGFVEQIIQYTDYKLEPAFLVRMSAPENNRSQLKNDRRKFKLMAERIEAFLRAKEKDDTLNWLIRVTAYDYHALALLKVFDIGRAIGDISDNGTILKRIIGSFEQAALIAEKEDIRSNRIWPGFLKFNLARAYRYEYLLNGDSLSLEKLEDAIFEAIDIRRDWYTKNQYAGVFASAMSYEYFVAAQFDYSLRNDIEAYTDDSPAENLHNIESLKRELDKYCRDTELGRLYDIRDIINHLETRIKAEHGIE